MFDDTRKAWNARPPTRPNTVVPMKDRKGFSWHWAGPATRLFGKSHLRCLEQVRDWQEYHQRPGVLSPTGAKDIGYNALICPHARAIEGRGINYTGSHSPGVNYDHFGIQFMTGDGEGVTPAMFARAAVLRRDIHALAVNANRDWSHKDDPKASTSCAGNQITAWAHSTGPLDAPAKPSIPTDPKEFTVADADDARVLLTTPLTRKARYPQAETDESALQILARTSRETTATLTQLGGLEAAIGKMLDLLAAQAAGFELPSKAEILAQVRASADARMASLQFDDEETS